jgi:hypothetical protein
MALYLDRTLPEVERSAELLLAEPGDLPLLARLQRERVVANVGAGLDAVDLPRAPLHRARALALASFAGSLLLGLAWPLSGSSPAPEQAAGRSAAQATAGPQVVAVRVTVTPPAYTGRSEHRVDGLDVRAEQDASVLWEVEVRGATEPPVLVFDESERVSLERRAGDVFTIRRQADEGHLYRLEAPAAENPFDSYARFEVVPDRPPEVEILAPAAFVELGPEAGARLEVRAELADDYGLGPVSLVATVASGFGELVEFRERRIEFDSRTAQADGTVIATSRLALAALGMKPGVELFLFAEARDSREPRPNIGRSATHIVRMPGGSARSVGLSARLPVLRVPEFFRSQRQIILDTEKLLADEEGITTEDFRRRSEALGFDQRALRMRYGGLLGEEFESGRPADAGHEAGPDEEHGEEIRRLDEMAPSRRGDPADAWEALPEGFAHQHDSAEIATYFDSDVKADLKAALAEMWGAEGRLRGLVPRDALPFEYRALQLLKSVQQRSRLYVQKIGFEPPQIYPREARLTGELGDIRTVRRRALARDDPALDAVRATLTALTEQGSGVPAPSSEDLAAAARLLAERARDDPAFDLAGLESLRGWIRALEQGALDGAAPESSGTGGRTAWRHTAIAALWALLPEPEASPASSQATSTSLAASYRRHLAAEGWSPEEWADDSSTTGGLP